MIVTCICRARESARAHVLGEVGHVIIALESINTHTHTHTHTHTQSNENLVARVLGEVGREIIVLERGLRVLLLGLVCLRLLLLLELHVQPLYQHPLAVLQQKN